MKRLILAIQLGLLLIFTVSACTRQPKQTAGDALELARDQVLSRIAERYARLSDYSLVGTRCLSACASVSPQVQHFRLQLRTPGLFMIDLPKDKQKLAFDGEDFLSLNGQTQVPTYQRIKVAGSEDGGLNQNSMLPFQVLSQFVVEGWRAPPLNTANSVPARWLSQEDKNAKSRLLVLSRRLHDRDLDRVDYLYRWPQAVFVEKRFVDKQGQVRKRIRVEKSFSENQGRDAYPKQWSSFDGQGQILSWTKLDSIELNRGLPKKHFKLSVPANYLRLP